MSSPLRLRTFGGLSVERDGSPASGAGAQRRPLALLALLAAAGERGISRAKLVGLLWPESDEEKARRVLAQTLYSLRRDLGADDLIVGTTELRANPEVLSADLRDFQNAAERGDAQAAASVYAGPFLDGFYLPGATEFERWADETRGALAHQYVAILERLVESAIARRDVAAEISWCRKLAAAEPLSARHAVRLMQALARSGDRAGALRHARVHEQLVRSELDCPPDASVTALAERLRGEQEASVATAVASPPAPAPLVPSPTPATQNPAVHTSHAGAEPESVGATQEWLLKLAGEPLPRRKSAPMVTSPVINKATQPVATGAVSGAAAASRNGTDSRARGFRRRAAVAAVAVVAMATTWLLWPRGGSPGDRPVIAVGGIVPLAADTSLLWVAQALPQLVATRLLESPEVDVAPVLPARSPASGGDTSVRSRSSRSARWDGGWARRWWCRASWRARRTNTCSTWSRTTWPRAARCARARS